MEKFKSLRYEHPCRSQAWHVCIFARLGHVVEWATWHKVSHTGLQAEHLLIQPSNLVLGILFEWVWYSSVGSEHWIQFQTYFHCRNLHWDSFSPLNLRHVNFAQCTMDFIHKSPEQDIFLLSIRKFSLQLRLALFFHSEKREVLGEVDTDNVVKIQINLFTYWTPLQQARANDFYFICLFIYCPSLFL